MYHLEVSLVEFLCISPLACPFAVYLYRKLLMIEMFVEYVKIKRNFIYTIIIKNAYII